MHIRGQVEHYLLDGNGIGLLGERFANLGKVAIVVIFITDLKKIVSHEALNFQAYHVPGMHRE